MLHLTPSMLRVLVLYMSGWANLISFNYFYYYDSNVDFKAFMLYLTYKERNVDFKFIDNYTYISVYIYTYIINHYNSSAWITA